MSSLVFGAMLDSLGLKKSFAIYTAIDGVLLLAAYFMVSERRKPSQRKQIVWFDKSFFTDPVFWSLGGCFLFTVFGYLSPVFFLPTFAQEKLPNLCDTEQQEELLFITLIIIIDKEKEILSYCGPQ